MQFTNLEKELIIYSLKQTILNIKNKICSVEETRIEKENLKSTICTLEDIIEKLEEK